MATHNFRELIIWQRAKSLTIDVYKLTSKLPESERFGLISQMRRSAISISSNIAEGSGRGTNKDFARFLKIALSSAYELETQLIISFELFEGNIEKEAFTNLIGVMAELQKMIFAFEKKLSVTRLSLLSLVSFL